MLTIATTTVNPSTSPTTATPTVEPVLNAEDDRHDWNQALVEAARAVIPWATQSSVGPIPYVPNSDEGVIYHRSDWLLDKYASNALIDIELEKSATSDLAVALVSAKLCPDNLPETIELPTVKELIARANLGHETCWNYYTFDVDEKYTEACELLRSNWSRIEDLAGIIQVNPVMTARAVWEVIHPGVNKLQRIGAYHLAAAAVAARHIGMTPTYLSIFCGENESFGYCFEYPLDKEKQPVESSPLDTAVVALAGPMASLKATGEAKLASFSGFLTEFFSATPNAAEDWLARATLSVDAAFRASEIIGTKWTTIENLATVLLREYDLLAEEITFILDGGAVEDWVRTY